MAVVVLVLLIAAFIFIIKASSNNAETGQNYYSKLAEEERADEKRRELKGKNELLETIEARRVAKGVYSTYERFKNYVLDEEQKNISDNGRIAYDYFREHFLKGKKFFNEYVFACTGELALKWGYLPMIISQRIPKGYMNEDGEVDPKCLWESDISYLPSWDKNTYRKEEDEEEYKNFIDALVGENEFNNESQKTQDALASKIKEPFVIDPPVTEEEMIKAREIIQEKIKEREDLVKAIIE